MFYSEGGNETGGEGEGRQIDRQKKKQRTEREEIFQCNVASMIKRTREVEEGGGENEIGGGREKEDSKCSLQSSRKQPKCTLKNKVEIIMAAEN